MSVVYLCIQHVPHDELYCNTSIPGIIVGSCCDLDEACFERQCRFGDCITGRTDLYGSFGDFVGDDTSNSCCFSHVRYICLGKRCCLPSKVWSCQVQ